MGTGDVTSDYGRCGLPLPRCERSNDAGQRERKVVGPGRGPQRVLWVVWVTHPHFHFFLKRHSPLVRFLLDSCKSRRTFPRVIYFITSNAIQWYPVKIGYAKHPEGRLVDLRVGCPWPLEIFALLPGGRDVEQVLHLKFREYRMQGEWFRNEGEVRDAMLWARRQWIIDTGGEAPPEQPRLRTPDQWAAHLRIATAVRRRLAVKKKDRAAS